MAFATGYAATVTIDGAGRIVIPRQFRDRLHLDAGARLVLEEVDGTITLTPAPIEVTLQRKGRVLVAVPRAEVPTVSTDEVRDVVEDIRDR